jgi:hypothetical protein
VHRFSNRAMVRRDSATAEASNPLCTRAERTPAH